MKATRDSIMLQFWFPKEEFHIYLQPMIGYSEFCRNAILKEIQLVNSDQYANSKIEYYQNKVKKWKERKKSSKVDTSKVKEVLQKHYESFKQNDRMATEDYLNWRWIEDKIIPELKPLGCKLNKVEILEIFQDFYRKGRALINV